MVVYLNAAKMLEEMNGRLQGDTKAAQYLCETYKKSICILMDSMGIDGFAVDTEKAKSYKENYPTLLVWEGKDGSMIVKLENKNGKRN